MHISFAEFLKAQERISPYLKPTPLLYSYSLSHKTGKNVWLKLECQNLTHSFKIRAAFNALLANINEAKRVGVLTTSSGNYAQAVAYAAQTLGIQATIVMTPQTLPIKVQKTKEYGAKVVFCGPTFESRFETIKKIQSQTNALVIHGFDSLETIAGNGTIGLELYQQLNNQPASIFCPASGGGLISGIALTLKELHSEFEIIGCQPANGGAIFQSLQKKQRITIPHFETIADALVATQPGQNTFEIISKLQIPFYLVSEDKIKAATEYLFYNNHLLSEPGGATSVAVMLEQFQNIKHTQIVCIISGSNQTYFTFVKH